jgi:hypothetical protein
MQHSGFVLRRQVPMRGVAGCDGSYAGCGEVAGLRWARWRVASQRTSAGRSAHRRSIVAWQNGVLGENGFRGMILRRNQTVVGRSADVSVAAQTGPPPSVLALRNGPVRST